MVAWADYAEDGCNDPDADWVSAVREESGCQVNVTLGNSDEMVTLMQSGNFDGVSASGDASNGSSPPVTSPRSSPTW